MELHGHQARLLLKLYRHRCFGKGHMLEDHLLTGFPSHAVGDARDNLERLKRAGVLVAHKTKHGPSVFIAARLRLEVYDALRRAYPWLPR